MNFFDRLVRACIETRAREKSRIREFFVKAPLSHTKPTPSQSPNRRKFLFRLPYMPSKLPLAVPKPSTVQAEHEIVTEKPSKITKGFKKSIMD